MAIQIFILPYFFSYLYYLEWKFLLFSPGETTLSSKPWHIKYSSGQHSSNNGRGLHPRGCGELGSPRVLLRETFKELTCLQGCRLACRCQQDYELTTDTKEKQTHEVKLRSMFPAFSKIKELLLKWWWSEEEEGGLGKQNYQLHTTNSIPLNPLLLKLQLVLTRTRGLWLFFKDLASFKQAPVTATQHHSEMRKLF